MITKRLLFTTTWIWFSGEVAGYCNASLRQVHLFLTPHLNRYARGTDINELSHKLSRDSDFRGIVLRSRLLLSRLRGGHLRLYRHAQARNTRKQVRLGRVKSNYLGNGYRFRQAIFPIVPSNRIVNTLLINVRTKFSDRDRSTRQYF